MVCSPGYDKICYFHEIKMGQAFSSTKEDADYIKIDEISGRRIWRNHGEIGLFEESDLVYVGGGSPPGVIY